MEGGDAPGDAPGSWLPDELDSSLLSGLGLSNADVPLDELLRMPSDDLVRALGRWRARARGAVPPTNSPHSCFADRRPHAQLTPRPFCAQEEIAGVGAAVPRTAPADAGAEARPGGTEQLVWDQVDFAAATARQAPSPQPQPPSGVPQAAAGARAAPAPPPRLCCVRGCGLPLPVEAGGRGRVSAVVKFERRYRACRTHMRDTEVDVGDGPQRYCVARAPAFASCGECGNCPRLAAAASPCGSRLTHPARVQSCRKLESRRCFTVRTPEETPAGRLCRFIGTFFMPSACICR